MTLLVAYFRNGMRCCLFDIHFFLDVGLYLNADDIYLKVYDNYLSADGIYLKVYDIYLNADGMYLKVYDNYLNADGMYLNAQGIYLTIEGNYLGNYDKRPTADAVSLFVFDLF